jgi:hypothetical protein
MDKCEDYPIKVLDMASWWRFRRCLLSSPLVGASFELNDPSPKISLLSLSSLWMASRCEWLSPLRMAVPHELRVEGPSGARKGGPNRPPEWARTADLGRPAQAHPSPVRSPLRSRGSSCVYVLCPLHLHYFDDVILVSKMEVLLAWSPVFYASILGDVPL